MKATNMFVPNATSSTEGEIDILPSASLSMTITLPVSSSPSRSSRSPAFRAVQRPDGVIIESPRYLPPPSSSSSSSPHSSFEPQPITFTPTRIPQTSSMLKRARRAKKREQECTVRMCGRGGYNGPKEMESKERKEMEDVRMQMFLEEDGPWCGIGC